jgi:cell pole-organizing protein PopZ
MTESQTSGAQGAQSQPAAPAADPSMEDILASIRRILSEDEAQVAAAPPAGQGAPASGEIDGDDVLVLDESMMAPDEVASFPAPPAQPLAAALPQTAPPPLAPAVPLPAGPAGGPSALLGPEAADAAASAMGTLIRTLADHPTGDPLTPLQVRGGGPTIEDIVREEIRPLLKAWLDANLPTLTERLVREEIQRLADRAAH